MLPIRDSIPCTIKPYISWGLIASCVFVFLNIQIMPAQMQHQVLYAYGMVPIRYSDPNWAAAFGFGHDYSLSFLTSLFLHAGWLHLITNIWFIWIFADAIEERMGHKRFLAFYLLCGLAAMLLQWFFNPKVAVPVIGASGAVAGVLGAYFFMYPYARVVLWFPLFLLPIFFEVPAIAFLGLWVILQLQGATSAIMFQQGAMQEALWAHIGGFIAGAFLYRFFLNAQTDLEVDSQPPQT